MSDDVVTFDTKIAVVVRDDLLTWQKLKVTAFPVSGVVGATAGLRGEPHEDALGHRYTRCLSSPS